MAETMSTMDLERSFTQDGASIHTFDSNSDIITARPATPSKYDHTGMNGSANSANIKSALPEMPAKLFKSTLSPSLRPKKKVPWKGKNIIVLIPRDEERGQPGRPPMPLDAAGIESMLRSWEQLGYNTRGFDLATHESEEISEKNSISRDEWPAVSDMIEERSGRQYQVTLPDLNAWKNYVNELAEAKLRALGVTFAEEEPAPLLSESPVPSNMSRSASNQHPPFPFSPPLPAPPITSNGQSFPFPSPFFPGGLSASQSPGIPAVPSPVSLNGPTPMKFNGRASISISPHELQFHLPGQPSPLGWPPHMLLQQQQHGRNGSPGGLNMMPSGSPFTPDSMSASMGVHQRHQSLQYPMLPHQFIQRQDSAGASPRLEEVREDEEEEEIQTNPYDQSPAKTPDPTQFIQHNASNSLQKEIDEAEYHLEEQFRSQLEHEDYSPHNEAGPLPTDMPVDNFVAAESLHPGAVHFSGIRADADDGPKLHHPQPHSRGHSLSQNPYYDNDEVRDSTPEGSIRKPQASITDVVKADNTFEVETNPSNLGTPTRSFDSTSQGRDRSTSMASNPWAGSEPFPVSNPHSRQGSHNSKSSLSKLNAGAAEFKFNPKSTFTPGQFVFGGAKPQASPFTPTSSKASTVPGVLHSATSSHISVPSNASSTTAKLNPTSRIFSPHKTDFSFSSTGPKFNPDAKAFQPMRSLAPSLASAGVSGNESAEGRPKPIFGNINLSSPEFVQPVRKPKAGPIMRPSTPASPTPAAKATGIDAAHGQKEPLSGDVSRVKKQFRNDDNGDGDDVPLFAEPMPESVLPSKADSEPTPLDTEAPSMDELEATGATTDAMNDEQLVNTADVTLASTVASESTDGKVPSESNDTNDTKATTTPSATSPDVDKATWRPVEFTAESGIPEFNGKPVDAEPAINEPEKPQVSTTTKSLAPGGFMFGSPELVNTPFKPEFVTQPEQLAEVLDESVDDGAGSPTPGPDPSPATLAGIEEAQQGEPAAAKPVPTFTGLLSSRFAPRLSTTPKPVQEPASHTAVSPPLVSERRPTAPTNKLEEAFDAHSYEQLPVSPPSESSTQSWKVRTNDLTFEEIDAVMKQINETDPTMGVKKLSKSSKRQLDLKQNVATNSLPAQLPRESTRDETPSPSSRIYQERVFPKPSTELEDPFLDASHSPPSPSTDLPVRRLNTRDDLPESDWDDTFSASEQGKFEQRVHYFDGHVNTMFDNLLASRLDPLENTLSTIREVLSKLPHRTPSRRDRRSISAEVQDSDADDEDEELPTRRSTSPKRDKRMEQIRLAVLDGLSQHQILHDSSQSAGIKDNQAKEESTVMKALEDMKLQIAESMPNFRSEDLRNIVEEAISNRKPPTPPPVTDDEKETTEKLNTMQSTIRALEERLRGEGMRCDMERSRVHEMEERLRAGEAKVESEVATRRAAEDRMADLRRQLEQAETKVEVEIMNRSIFDQRIHDLEDRLKSQESKSEVEISIRREAEDRLSEVQRLLRIASEEEDRLRAVMLERDQKIRNLEQASGKMTMHISIMEAAQASAEQTHAELKNRLNYADAELRETRQEARHWRSEAEQARDSMARQTDSFVAAVKENKHLHKLIDTLGVQIEENERIRDNWRAKFVSLQNDMAHAAREITEENSRRSKKEQALIARHEVLDARLQAEARTRERLEVEVARLENGERAGMRAVAECKRLEALLAELRNDNHELHQQVLRSQREVQEARDTATSDKQNALLEIQAAKDAMVEDIQRVQLELQEVKASAAADVQRAHLEVLEAKDSAAAELNRANQEVLEAKELAGVEIQKVRDSVSAELEAARDQTNIAKADFEEELARIRAELDQVRMEADTASAHHDMMLEESQNTKETELQALKNAKAAELEELAHKHQNELEDLQARYERQISSAAEDAQRTEQTLLERLSLSTSKTEHLQDRVAHLEEKVQIAQEAARAAAQAAAQASKTIMMPELSAHPGPVGQTKQLAQAMQLPEKISPQALRESIMVLQEQLQAREQRIEELEQKVADLDPDAATKISKRDDEIIWLRELLAVRHGDLQDIIGALSAERFDRDAVKDAAIRLKANLQMEEQERERAMNGGSALNLPNIAATISKAATPRVAQAVGPLAAAWGSWRRSNQAARTVPPSTMSAAGGRDATPSRSNPSRPQNRRLLSGLMTPPTSRTQATPQAEPSQPQPTAFGNTGRRYTAEQYANRSRGPSVAVRQAEKMPAVSTPPPRQEQQDPRTPPMMQSNSYDDDAHMEEFDDASFFDD